LLRRTFRLKRDEVTGGWRKLHNDNLYNLYSPSSIIRTIKSKEIRCAGRIARIWVTIFAKTTLRYEH
jgi:hypothetical protein